ncbi:hypothetical protein Ple7327_2130 [Pleurocapsa sp. PCC 7327]|nr:hypothetical protein Ple7327_2130 [Pleurocapsa sp. PCC 7327]
MLNLKPKKLTLTILLALFGLAYFSSLSNWEINVWLRNYIAIAPLQILALLYVYFYWKRRRIKNPIVK